MATRIRLARGGKKKRPYYRIVVADSRAPRDGRFIERIGSYDPLLSENKVTVDLDRAMYWLNVGARPSERVSKLLALQGVEHKLVVVRKSPPKPAADAKADMKDAAKDAGKGKAAAKDKEEAKAEEKAEAKAEQAPAEAKPEQAEAKAEAAEAQAEEEAKPAKGKAKAADKDDAAPAEDAAAEAEAGKNGDEGTEAEPAS